MNICKKYEMPLDMDTTNDVRYYYDKSLCVLYNGVRRLWSSCRTLQGLFISCVGAASYSITRKTGIVGGGTESIPRYTIGVSFNPLRIIYRWIIIAWHKAALCFSLKGLALNGEAQEFQADNNTRTIGELIPVIGKRLSVYFKGEKCVR